MNDSNFNIYQQVFNTTEQYITILDVDFSIKSINKSMLSLLHLSEEEALSYLYWELPLWGDNPEIQNQILFSIQYSYLEVDINFEIVCYDNNNKPHDVEFTIKPIYDSDGNISMLCAMGYDVTKTKNAINKMKFMEKEIQMFFDYSKDGYYIKSLENPISIDTNINELFEYVYENEQILRYNNSVIDFLYYDDFGKLDFYGISKEKTTKKERLAFFKKMIKNRGIKEIFEYKIKPTSKKTYYIELTYAPIIEDNFYRGSFGVIRDITKEKQYEHTLFKNANYDTLTELPNRRYFSTQFNKLLKNFKNKKFDSICVVIFDIDFFKKINDTYGHDIGDLVLKKLASIMKKHSSNNTFFARLGGEEFSLFTNLSADNTLLLVNEVLNETRKKIIKFENPNKEELSLSITLSAGIAEFKTNDDLSSILKKADIALYKAKISGKDQALIFKDDYLN